MLGNTALYDSHKYYKDLLEQGWQADRTNYGRLQQINANVATKQDFIDFRAKLRAEFKQDKVVPGDRLIRWFIGFGLAIIGMQMAMTALILVSVN